VIVSLHFSRSPTGRVPAAPAMLTAWLEWPIDLSAPDPDSKEFDAYRAARKSIIVREPVPSAEE